MRSTNLEIFDTQVEQYYFTGVTLGTSETVKRQLLPVHNEGVTLELSEVRAGDSADEVLQFAHVERARYVRL